MDQRRLYSFAHLGGVDCGLVRIKGVGLANCLFPWARCAVLSKRYGLERIASTWRQFCHRQWIRGDRDKRTYAHLFNEAPFAITGARKLGILSTAGLISESEFLENPENSWRGVVLFSGMESLFSEILTDFIYVQDLLVKSTRREQLTLVGRIVSPFIGIHVRLGDFLPPECAVGAPGCWNVRQPLTWYIHVLKELRHSVPPEIPALVFSDGSDDEIRAILNVENTRRATFGSSIADLIALSRARILVASASTFSMWASYLGRMPVIWPVGYVRQRLHGCAWEYEVEVGSGSLPESMVSLANRILQQPDGVRGAGTLH